MSGVGEEVKRLRQAKGWTQEQLAVYAGSSQPTVNLLEAGKRNPSATTLEKLARALSVEVADLFREPAVPLAEAPREAGLADADPSGGLAAAAMLEEFAELWAGQLARGFYDRHTLVLMRRAGFMLAVDHEHDFREVRETLPPRFRAQLEAAEERFADIGARLWEAQQVLEEDGRGYPTPPDELAAKREAKREELRQQLRGRQAQHA
jgi:transcriptional regulator with XRE-family HTH domain